MVYCWKFNLLSQFYIFWGLKVWVLSFISFWILSVFVFCQFLCFVEKKLFCQFFFCCCQLLCFVSFFLCFVSFCVVVDVKDLGDLGDLWNLRNLRGSVLVCQSVSPFVTIISSWNACASKKGMLSSTSLNGLLGVWLARQ